MRRICYGEQLALFIIVADELGFEVGWLSYAKDRIEKGIPFQRTSHARIEAAAIKANSLVAAAGLIEKGNELIVQKMNEFGLTDEDE